jgi:hypothetical protein
MKKKAEKKIVHLHWLWHRGERGVLSGLKLGFAACGAGKVSMEQFTHEVKKANCPACHTYAKSYKAALTAMPAAAPSGARGKLNGQGLGHPSAAAPKGSRKAAPAQGTIKALTPRNPRKPGTGKHARMALLLKHNGKTVKEFGEAGGNMQTLKNAIKEKIVEVV